MSDVYRVGGPTHYAWAKEFESARNVIRERNAIVVDANGWEGVDPFKLEGLTAGGVEFIDYYRDLINTGYFHGWI